MRICSYFGNRYIDTYQEHLKEIKDHGFNTVLHPVNEQDVMFDRGEVQRLIHETKNQGLICMVDPHGLGNLFGYGSISKWENEEAHPDSPEFKGLISKWFDIVKDADWILWDEPKFTVYKDEVPMYSFLEDVTRLAYHKGIFNSVCLWGTESSKILDVVDRLAGMPYIDDIGVSYTVKGLEDSRYQADWIHLLSSYNKDSSIWVPGYEIKAGKEGLVSDAIWRARLCGVDNIGHWGFRGCEAMFYRSERPSEVWARAKSALVGPIERNPVNIGQM